MDLMLFGDKFLRAVWAGEPCSQSVADAMKGIDTTDIDIVFLSQVETKSLTSTSHLFSSCMRMVALG